MVDVTTLALAKRHTERLAGFPATNLVASGRGGDLTDPPWSWSATYTSAVGDAFQLNMAGPASLSQAIALSAGHAYYLTALGQIVSGDTGRLGVAYLKDGGYAVAPVGTGIDATETRRHFVTRLPEDSTGIRWTRTGIGNRVYLLRRIMLVDLTETFGAGNEPTVEECAVYFPEWFDSKVDALLTPRQMFLHFRSEIEALKAAVIAIGGTP